MLVELHTAATEYFQHTLRDNASWNDATARQLRARVLELAEGANLRGQAFGRFVAKVVAQVGAQA